MLVLGEFGGKSISRQARPAPRTICCSPLPMGPSLSLMTQMGRHELYAQGEEQQRAYIRDMRPTPVEAAFTFA